MKKAAGAIRGLTRLKVNLYSIEYKHYILIRELIANLHFTEMYWALNHSEKK